MCYITNILYNIDKPHTFNVDISFRRVHVNEEFGSLLIVVWTSLDSNQSSHPIDNRKFYIDVNRPRFRVNSHFRLYFIIPDIQSTLEVKSGEDMEIDCLNCMTYEKEIVLMIILIIIISDVIAFTKPRDKEITSNPIEEDL